MDPDNFKNKRIGSFILKKEIGEGAFSYVFLAEEAPPNQMVKKDKVKEKNLKTKKIKTKKPRQFACKIIPRNKIEAKKMTTRLDQEIKIHQLMHHPNVVQLVDVLKDESFYYIFLEYCPYGELFDYVIEKHKLSEHEAACFFKQILTGLKYIHSLNVAHRDLKPENVLLDQFGRIKISDFGLSKLIDIKANGLTKTPCGSPCYASPECISGQPYDGKKSDIWSCGVILYAITTGLLPWTKRNQAKMFHQIRKGEYTVPSYISDQCADLICRLMTVDNKKRITIDEALNHPFLKSTVLPVANLDPKYVSLRKVDRFLGLDKNHHLDKIIQNMSKGIFDTDTKFELKVLRVTKAIENQDEKIMMKDEIKQLSRIVKPRTELSRHRQKFDRNACQLLTRIGSNTKFSLFSAEEEDKNNKKKEKDKKKKDNLPQKPIPSPTVAPVAIPRKTLSTKKNDFDWVAQNGFPNLPQRRSEKPPAHILY